MPSARTRTFRSGNSQAVRLPKEVAYAEDLDVVVERQGDVVTIRPAIDEAAEKQKWLAFLSELGKLPTPSTVEVRELIEFPDRPGL